MTYHIIPQHLYIYTTFILFFAFHTECSYLIELLSAYFAFVEDDHSSTLTAAISLLLLKIIRFECFY